MCLPCSELMNLNFLKHLYYSSSAAEEETEAEVKSRKRSKEDEKDTTVVTPARKSARLAKPN